MKLWQMYGALLIASLILIAYMMILMGPGFKFLVS